MKDAGGCPYCRGLRVLIGLNDLKSQCPDIACEHADDLNALKSDEIAVKSGKAWWRGLKCCHVWNAWNPPGLSVGRKSMGLCSQCIHWYHTG